MNKKRKVLFVILEGHSDELFFFDALERYKNEHIVIKAYGGDIFTDPKQEKVEIRERIRTFFIDRLGDLKLHDVVGIVHVSDTDGSYIPDEKVIVNEEQKDTVRYTTEGIFVNEQNEKDKKEYRNHLKRRNTVFAANISYIQYKSVKIPYRLFYLSQNIEHVVFDKLNFPDKEKMKQMVTYLKRVRGTSEIEDLLKWLFPVIKEDSNNKYKNSWDFIMDNEHSLQRYTNAILIYDFITEITS